MTLSCMVDPMFLNKKIAAKFAKLEQNEKNYGVAEVVDTLAINALLRHTAPYHVADLFAGAHPDRYHSLFEKMIATDSVFDWVDASPVMMGLAREYLESEGYSDRGKVLKFIEQDYMKYLKRLNDCELDLVLIKYSFDYIKDVDSFFSLLSQKLKPRATLISTLTTPSSTLRSVSTNARFLYKGKEFPASETRELAEGDTFTIKFLKIPNDLSQGYVEGAETTKFFHSNKRIESLAEKYGMTCFIGNWKDYLKDDKYKGMIDQDVLVLEKR